MYREINEYVKYVLSFGEVKKPPMPNFDISAYNDNEYLLAIEDIMKEYEFLDDLHLTIGYIKGD